MRILELNTDSHPESLSEARRRCFDAMTRAGLRTDAAHDMEVAVGEALSNIYQHAYDGGVGPMFLEVMAGPGIVTISVRDEGRATDAPVVPRTLPPRTNIGGRGLFMIGRLCDDFTLRVNPSGHGLTARMTARLEMAVKGAPRPASHSDAGYSTADD